MALFKAWCKLTKKYEFTTASSEEEARENIFKKVKFKDKFFHLKDEDILKVYLHKPLLAFRIDFSNVGDSSTVFNVYVIATSEKEACYFLYNNTVIRRKIQWVYPPEDIKNVKKLYPEESFERGSVFYL